MKPTMILFLCLLLIIFGALPIFSDESCAVNFDDEFGVDNVGYYKFKVGQFDCIVVSDGQMVLSRDNFFVDIPQVSIEQSGEFFHLPSTLKAFLNPIVCKMGKEYVLIDTGIGGYGSTQDRSGLLIQNLKILGISPQKITNIVITHLHIDHIGGLITHDSEITYPNAEIWIPEIEFQAYMNESNSDLLQFERVQGIIKRLTSTQKIKKYSSGVLFEGMQAIPTFGHNPGHHTLKITSNDEFLYYVGDLIFNEINIANPEWYAFLDNDRTAAADSRLKFLKRAVEEKALLAVYHVNFPGMGYIEKNGGAFLWVPKQWEF